jgi:hypothetical protein
MWGTSSPDDKLTGDLGNVIEAAQIGVRRSDRLTDEKSSPGNFGLLQQYHHVADLAASRLQVLCCQASWTYQKFDPTPALPLCPGFRPSDEIHLCYDPNQSAACVNDRQAAEFALQHQPDGVGDRSVGGNAHGIRGHDVSGPHGVSSSFEFRAYLSAHERPLYDGKEF